MVTIMLNNCIFQMSSHFLGDGVQNILVIYNGKV